MKKGFSFKLVIALIVVAMIFPFFDVLFDGSKDMIAKVSDLKISKSEFRNAFEVEVRNLSNSGVPKSNLMDVNHNLHKVLNQLVLDTLVSKKLMQNVFNDFGLDLDRELISEIVQDVHSFKSDGKFDYEKYINVLSAANVKELDYLEAVKYEALNKMFLEAFAKLLNFGHQKLDLMLYEYSAHSRVVDVYKLDPELIQAPMNPPDEELLEIYESRDFFSPETRDAKYLCLCNIDVSVDEGLIEGYLNDHLEIVLTKLDLEYSIFSNEQEANNALSNSYKLDEKIDNVPLSDFIADFAEIVLKAEDGHSFIYRSVKEDVYYVFKLVKKRKLPKQSLEDDFIMQLRSSIRDRELSRHLDKLVDEVSDDIDSGILLDEVDYVYDYPVKSVNSVEESDKLAISVFNPESFVKAADGCYYYSYVTKIVEPEKLDFDKSRDIITKIWTENYIKKAIENLAQEIISNNGKNAEFKTYAFTRDKAESFLSPDLINEIFSSAEGVFVGPIDNFIAVTKNIIKPEFNDASVKEFKESLDHAIIESFYSDFKSHLESVYRVKFYQ